MTYVLVLVAQKRFLSISEWKIGIWNNCKQFLRIGLFSEKNEPLYYDKNGIFQDRKMPDFRHVCCILQIHSKTQGNLIFMSFINHIIQNLKTNQRQFEVYWLFLQNFKTFHTAIRPAS